MKPKKIKVLNLYACLGGNRFKWDEVADIAVTAVELDPELARMYQERFPNDTVIIADAHQYLLDHYKEFDFIWSSPPCPTHSRLVSSNKNKIKMRYPDMTLYQEIIFLDNFFNGKYCVENVIPYYEPLIVAQKRGRHLYWTNFKLPADINERPPIGISTGKKEHKRLEEFHQFKCNPNAGGYREVLRNLVDYEAGKTIFQTALGIINQSNSKQTSLFNTENEA
jgi:DNA (cytosine-5)-methyltransferase 1